jgi:hypothetical protein
MPEIYRGPVPLGSLALFFEWNSQKVITVRFNGVPTSRFLKVGWMGVELPAPTAEGVGLVAVVGKSLYLEPTGLLVPQGVFSPGFGNVRLKMRQQFADVSVRAD